MRIECGASCAAPRSVALTVPSVNPTFVEGAGGTAIATYDFGGDGPDVLFLHATGFHSHTWLPVIEHLRDSFHCYAADCRGHGESASPADRDFSWHRFADDARAVLDGLGLERPLGAGHSAGAATLLLAEQHRPNTFRALWCYEPVVFPPIRVSQSNSLADGARKRREVFPSRDEAFANYASKPPFNALCEDSLRAYVEFGFDDLESGEVRLKCRGGDEARVYEGGSAHGAFEHLGEVSVPVFLAGGAQPGSFGPQVMGAQHERLPRSELEIMEELGHFGPLEDPARIAAAIRRAFSTAA